MVTDRKLPHVVGDPDMGFEAELVSYANYYPFGWRMPGRSWEGSVEYRFGFNGKETDPEWGTASGSTYDYGFRIYNGALGRFLSVDPFAASYPWYTPYQFSGNKPIVAIDLDGLEEQEVNGTEVGCTNGCNEYSTPDAASTVLIPTGGYTNTNEDGSLKSFSINGVPNGN